MRSWKLLVIGTLATISPHVAAAADRPIVVELFTSQGCSSCPPANAYLNELSKQRSDVLALAFHVTYWDYLGWKDPFSLQTATDRQARYGRRFGDGSYTPEIVVDGGTGLVGSYRDDVNGAIARARTESRTAADVRVVARDGKVSIDVGSGQGAAKVYLVGFDREHVTAIGRGENQGRTMPESNIVRSFRPVADWRGTPVHIDQSLPDGEEIAVILEAPDGHIVGASRASGRGAS
ncbi:DUF1223 domain-containing protein [Bradyrhizobium genosp. P]|uniref:DUF1223 domain-containing protein n=1 Tax=Bradyrhizobium genosp. P TaxID=83641 RepID=UPI003CEEEE55